MKKNSLQLPIKPPLKRPFLLLEVLIAFTLIALCAIPLISPHISMIKAQKELDTKNKINHAANLLFAHLIEKLHKNEIPLTDFEEGKILAVPEEFLKGIAKYKATYRFVKKNSKQKDDKSLTVYLSTLELSFFEKKEQIVFATDVCVSFKKAPEPIQAAPSSDEEESEEV